MEVEVSITGPENAVIFYTTNGSTPTEQSTMYSSPFIVSDGTSVTAIAYLNGVASTVSRKYCQASDDH